MQLSNPASDFSAEGFEPADGRDLEACKQAYVAYMEHVLSLISPTGANYWETGDLFTSDGESVKQLVVSAVAYTNLAAGMLYARYGNEDDVEYHLSEEFWSHGDAASQQTGDTGETIVLRQAEGNLERCLEEGAVTEHALL